MNPDNFYFWVWIATWFTGIIFVHEAMRAPVRHNGARIVLTIFWPFVTWATFVYIAGYGVFRLGTSLWRWVVSQFDIPFHGR